MKSDSSDSHVFYVTSQGYAGDHWYSWFSKALNSNPEIFAYLANEGSRPKYFNERSRAERPNILGFTQFIGDVGRTYLAVGDCYSYRAPHMKLIKQKYGDEVRCINIPRHPYAWLYFYVNWRTGNMRMLDGQNAPIEHEWVHSSHDLFKQFNLMPYEKSDVHIWSFYQGLVMLNLAARDFDYGVPQYCLEDIASDPDMFKKVVSYLTHDRVEYSDENIDLVYGWLYTPFRGENKVFVTPEDQFASWEDWQKEAFDKIVEKKTIQLFEECGYKF